jgi:cell division protein FtsB
MSSRAQAARGYRMRPAPRGRRNRRAARINWDKVGRVALVLVLVAVVASYISPTINFLDAWRDSKAESTRLDQLKEENQRLRGRVATMAEPDAAERAARRAGMAEVDEVPFVLK